MERQTQAGAAITKSYRASVWGLGATMVALTGAVCAPIALLMSKAPQAQTAVAGVLAACGCTSAVLSVERHWEYIAYALLAAGGSWVAFAAVRAWSVLGSTHRFTGNCERLAHEAGGRTKRVTRYLGIRYPVDVIDTGELLAASYGVFHKRIVISRGTLARLTDEELAAVLLHEEAHLRHHDPLKKICITVAVQVFSWVPGFSKLASRYSALAELHADSRAIGRGCGRDALMRALLSLLDTTAYPAAGHAGFARSHAMDERVAWLTEARRPRGASILVPIVTAAILCGVTIGLVAHVDDARASSATAEIARCVETRAATVPYCAAATRQACRNDLFGPQSTIGGELCGQYSVDNGHFDRMTPFYYTD